MEKINKKLYWEQGYLVIENLFSDVELEYFYNRLSLHNDTEWNNILNPDRFDFLVAHTAEKISKFEKSSEKIKYLNECKKTATNLRSLLRDRRIVSILEHLYDSNLVGLSTHMIWKKSGTKNAMQAWNPHQDNSYGQNENSKLLTINLFLDDVTVYKGAIFNYPGSHKEGLLETDYEKSYADPNKPGKCCIIPEGYKQNDIEAKKGALYIQHGNLIHGSNANILADCTRGMFSASYIVEGEEFFSGKEASRKSIAL
jgi:ectoine hydroxylase-related dioxygenase (phytanoyl-CoA dioxygenase family)